MPWLTVPLRPTPFQKLRIAFEGVEYNLSIRWSEREARLYMDIFAANLL